MPFPACSVLMWRYTNVPSTVEDAGKKEKGQSVSLLCLEGLLRVFTTMLQRYPTRMSNFLSSLGGPLNTHFYIILMYVYGVLIKKKNCLKDVSGEGEAEGEGSDLTEQTAFYIRQFQVPASFSVSPSVQNTLANIVHFLFCTASADEPAQWGRGGVQQ